MSNTNTSPHPNTQWPPSESGLGPAGAGHAPAASSSAAPSPASVQTLATWALVLGIVCLFFNPLAGVSIASGVCGIVALVRGGDFARAGIVTSGRGMAIAGVVLAAVGLARTSSFGWFLF